MIQMTGKDFYDFSYNVDILVKSNGICGVAFRIRDFLNYYALVIDKKAGYTEWVCPFSGRASHPDNEKGG